VRSFLTGATFGWEPKIMGALPWTGPAAEAAMSERERQEKFRSEHPYGNFALGAAGGAASLMGAGRIAAATPYVGGAMAAGGNALGAIRNSVGWVPAAMAGGAAIGAPLGAIEAAGEDKPIGQGAVSGAVGGALLTPGLEGAGRAIGRAVSPWVSKYMAGEIADGARPTFGEAVASEDAHLMGEGGNALGKLIKGQEDVIAGLPLSGVNARQAQQLSRETMNRDMINKALEPISESIAPDTPVGRPMIKEMGDRLGKAYEDLIPRIRGSVDADLTTGIQKAEKTVPLSLRAEFQDITDRLVINNSDPLTGELSGKAFKNAESALREKALDLMSSGDAFHKDLGRAVGKVRDELFDMMDRHNTPDVVDRLRDINHGYSINVLMEKAAGFIGAKDGVFNASQLVSALKATDQSARKRGFSRGTAKLQDAIENAKAAMAPTINDSGTAGRSEIGGLAAAAFFGHPYALAAPLVTNALYTRPVQSALRGLAAGGFETRGSLANALRGLAPQAGALIGPQNAAPLGDYLTGN
jgi:hypothetical protein